MIKKLSNLTIDGRVAAGIAFGALILSVLHATDNLPAGLVRLDESLVPPFAPWLDAIFNYIKGLVLDNTMFASMVIKEGPERLTLSNNTVIEIGTANNRALRGYTISCAILDEIAFWNADGLSTDAEILKGLRPALATLKGPLIALSSPYARKGVLWNTYRRHFGAKGKILVAQASSEAMNSTLPKDIINDAYDEDHAAACAEWGAHFRKDIEDKIAIERANV